MKNSTSLAFSILILVQQLKSKMTKVAVVTGSNKGIGFAVVKGLFGKFDGDIFLTARSEERGLAAVEELKKVTLFSSQSKIFLKIIIILYNA